MQNRTWLRGNEKAPLKSPGRSDVLATWQTKAPHDPHAHLSERTLRCPSSDQTIKAHAPSRPFIRESPTRPETTVLPLGALHCRYSSCSGPILRTGRVSPTAANFKIEGPPRVSRETAMCAHCRVSSNRSSSSSLRRLVHTNRCRIPRTVTFDSDKYPKYPELLKRSPFPKFCFQHCSLLNPLTFPASR